jgi:hypothetical protein
MMLENPASVATCSAYSIMAEPPLSPDPEKFAVALEEEMAVYQGADGALGARGGRAGRVKLMPCQGVAPW